MKNIFGKAMLLATALLFSITGQVAAATILRFMSRRKHTI